MARNSKIKQFTQELMKSNGISSEVNLQSVLKEMLKTVYMHYLKESFMALPVSPTTIRAKYL